MIKMGGNIKLYENVTFGPRIAGIIQTAQKITSYKHCFNKISIENASVANYPATFVESMVSIGQALAKYGHWKESSLTNADDLTIVRDAVKNVMTTASDIIAKTAEPDTTNDPYKLLDMQTLLDNREKLAGLWMTFTFSPRDEITAVLQHAFEVSILSLMETMRTLTVCLKIEDNLLQVFSDSAQDIICLPKDVFYEMHNEFALKLTLHEEVVFHTPAEKEEMAKEAARIKAAEEQKEKAMARINESKARAEVILKCYDRHMQHRNLTAMFIKPDMLTILRNPTCQADCDKIDALYALLMSMSDSVRYMPGEEGEPERRIDGSFMELDKEVCTYGARFLVYTGAYGLDHNSVVDALSTIGWRPEGAPESEVHVIYAQYTETKKFIQEKISGENPRTIRAFHLFKQS